MSTVLDTTRTQAFAERTLGTVNGGSLSLMLSIGHRTALFDELARRPPSTSDQIEAGFASVGVSAVEGDPFNL